MRIARSNAVLARLARFDRREYNPVRRRSLRRKNSGDFPIIAVAKERL